ncbi:pectinesterase family protein [Neokomagataea anthophila]|uniref:Pectinesterase n=1 Tax=Neokomagataea anthophila TaxID=2826925 RepID=A0ABS5E6X9_9PROT|nr:pectinesterase family protein [Neokomagataea anthophila]MBR0559561.1 hypothetical protein [Neokomagataea anthophila]
MTHKAALLGIALLSCHSVPLAFCASPILHVGAGQPYTHIQDALDAAPENATILIAPGLYHEVIHISTPGLQVQGEGSTPADVRIESSQSADQTGGTSHSATVFAEADKITLSNLTITNRFHDDHPDITQGAQAVALSATGDRQSFLSLHLVSYQDTLFAGSHGCNLHSSCSPARQYYQDDVIDGAVDFIFGDARAYFEHCILHGIARPTVTITAQGRTFPEHLSGYVFHNCSTQADPAVQHISLGRPWRDYASVAYIDCTLDPRVVPSGFTEWQGQSHLTTAHYLIASLTNPQPNTHWEEPYLLHLPLEDLTKLAEPKNFFSDAPSLSGSF